VSHPTPGWEERVQGLVQELIEFDVRRSPSGAIQAAALGQTLMTGWSPWGWRRSWT